MSLINAANAWKVIKQNLAVFAGTVSLPDANLGLLRLLTSPAWIRQSRIKLGNLSELDSNDGKKYQIVREFLPVVNWETESDGKFMDTCLNDGKEVKPKYDTLEIRYYHKSAKLKVSEEMLRCIQMGRADYQDQLFNQMLIQYLNELGYRIATLVGNPNNGYIGNFKNCDCEVPAETCRELPLFQADGRTPNPVGMEILNNDYRESISGMPFTVIGGQLLDAYRNVRQIALANGVVLDLPAMDINAAIFIDPNLTTAMGNRTKKVLAIEPGALQLQTFTRNSFQQMPSPSGIVSKTVITDPYLGLRHDLNVTWDECAEAYFMQIGIGYDVFGLPSCWTEKCEWQGVTGVYCYDIICADASFCDLDTRCGKTLGGQKLPEGLCDSALPCEVTCKANFGTECDTFARFTTTSTATAVNAFRVNGGLDVALSQSYNLTNSSDSAAFVAELKTKLGMYGAVVLVSGYFSGGSTILNVMTKTNVTSIILVNGVADVDLTRTTSNYIHVYDLSTPSTGATLSTLSWITGDSTATGAGAPSAAIVGVTGIIGDFGNYFAAIGQGGTFQLTMADSASCADTYSANSEECPVTWPLVLTTFTDTDDDDTQDGGEAVLAGVVLKLYGNVGLTQLVDTQTTNVSGQATFNVPTGTYYVTVDTTTGAASGLTLSTTLPKAVSIDLGGNIVYSNAWTEDGLVPITPAP